MTELVVETAQGRVRGEPSHGARAWKGIPYAEPPLGPLRFLPPRPPRAWTGERDATRYGAVAVQSRDPRAAMMSGITDRMAMSEDCLVLNVFAPPAATKRPVLVWIHGGAFIMGAGSLPLYNGAGFATRHDLVVVTLNYRLGVLGFLYLGELAGERYASGNHALLDQIAALRWVRDNIAAFGGDPDAVTVMGESAGAVAVSHLLAMPEARGLFQRAILQSGAPGLSPPTLADAAQQARRVVDECGATPDTIAEVPVERLLAVQEAISRERGIAAFTPYVDGVTIPRAPIESVRDGSAANVPLLLGSNRDEWALFAVFIGDAATDALVRVLRSRLGDAVDRIHERYLAERAGSRVASDDDARRAWGDMLGDLAFRIPMIRIAEAHASYAPVYMYRFDWESRAMNGRLGAAHALELPFVWNRLDNPLTQMLIGGDTAEAQPLALEMHDRWAAFVRTAEPALDGGLIWPRYDATRRATLLFDRSSRIVDDPDSASRTVWPF